MIIKLQPTVEDILSKFNTDGCKVIIRNNEIEIIGLREEEKQKAISLNVHSVTEYEK